MAGGQSHFIYKARREHPISLLSYVPLNSSESYQQDRRKSQEYWEKKA